MIVNGWAIALVMLHMLGLIISLVRIGKGDKKIVFVVVGSDTYEYLGRTGAILITLHLVLLAGALGAFS